MYYFTIYCIKVKAKIKMEKSIIKNSIYNLIKTIVSLIFPVISFSYASRVLGVDRIGSVYFSKNFVVYFSMLAQFGMNYYGIREGAKLRQNREQLSKFVHEMLLINILTTIFAYVIFGLTVISIPKLYDYRILLLVNSITIFMQGLGVEWLYHALEEYRYISIRMIIFQLIGIFLLLIFVRQPNDVIAYSGILVFAGTGSYILNFLNIRKFIDLKKIGNYNIKQHINPILLLFAMSISIQLYAVMDSTMLGFLSNDTEVGRYTAAVKINKIVCNIITSIGIVLIPRLSFHVKNKNRSEIVRLTEESLNIIFFLSVPLCVTIFLLSKNIVVLFSGASFIEATQSSRILSGLVILIPFSVVCNTQTFVPLAKEKYILKSTFAGAISNFILNYLLIPKYGNVGASISTLFSEFVVAIICFYHMTKLFDMNRIFKYYYQYWIAIIPTLIIGCILKKYDSAFYIEVVLILLSLIGYCITLWIMKNRFFMELSNSIYSLFCPKR